LEEAMILLIDNFDSFTHNIYQYLRQLGHEVMVERNNSVTIDEIEDMAPSHLIISPGPSRPESAGVSVAAVRYFRGKIPILGICLGHQAIGAAFGGEIVRARRLLHGKSSEIFHDGKGIFAGITNPFQGIRYHSLIIDRSSLPGDLEITAWTEEGEVMGVRHKLYTVEGVQFHPESVGTEHGLAMLDNFVNQRPDTTVIQSAIKKVVSGNDLTVSEAEKVMDEITSGDASAAQIAAILTAMGLKGESVSEITGFARVMRRKATPVDRPNGKPVLDTCGTGGDASGTFNISTAAAFVAAGAGITVAKHGNRSITSRCGSADLLEAIGINIMTTPERMTQALDRVGIAFLFAPKLHGAMKHAVPVRVSMGIRTAFNLLGPLANPAGADYQIIGVFSDEVLDKVAHAMIQLGTRRAMVVHGCDGLDEITMTGPTRVIEVKDGWLKRYNITPGDFGFSTCTAEDLRGGELKTNCEILLSVLEGEKGPKRDVTVLNAAAAIYLGEKSADMHEAVDMAARSIDSGAAMRKMEELIAFTNS
jgi:anthranilate synthase/phosphoribosyltransferase